MASPVDARLLISCLRVYNGCKCVFFSNEPAEMYNSTLFLRFRPEFNASIHSTHIHDVAIYFLFLFFVLCFASSPRRLGHSIPIFILLCMRLWCVCNYSNTSHHQCMCTSIPKQTNINKQQNKPIKCHTEILVGWEPIHLSPPVQRFYLQMHQQLPMPRPIMRQRQLQCPICQLQAS